MKKDSFTIKEKEYKEFVKELKLHVNKKLFEKGIITDDIYTKAKEIIVSHI